MYTDGTAPVESAWDLSTPWSQDKRYLRAADLFDHRFYWEAHEAWEALWHFTDKGTPEHALLQSLIQASAGLLKLHMGDTKSAHSLIDRAEQRLTPFINATGPVLRGIDTPILFERIRQCFADKSWPLIPMESA